MTVFDPLLSTLPAVQRAVWPSLRQAQELGFVLYGGTGTALRNRGPDNSPTLSSVKRGGTIRLVVDDRECRGPMPAQLGLTA